MAGYKINQLPRASGVASSDLFPKDNPGGTSTEAATAEQLREYILNDVMSDIEEKGEEVCESIEEKGEEVLDSIPEDYTELLEDVADLKSAIEYTASALIGSVEGNPAVITDAAGERVLRSVKVNIEPVQDGSGDPAPDNVRAISGWTGAHIMRHGENLVDFDDGAYTTTMYGRLTDGVILSSNFARSVVIPCRPNTAYTCSKRAGARCNVAWTKDVPEEGGSCYGAVKDDDGMRITITTGEDAAYLIFYFWHSTSDRPVTATEMLASVWIEYADVPEFFDLEFPTEAGTVYGGTLDATAGTLTVTRKKLPAMAWTRTAVGNYYVFTAKAADKAPNYNILCSHYKPVLKIRTGLLDKEIGVYNGSDAMNRLTVRDDSYTDAESFTEHMRDVDVVYELATPIVYQLTPVQIAALSGYNAIFADCGSVSVEYTQDTGAAIDAGDASTRGMIGEASGETASRSLAVGEYVTVGDKLYRVTSAVGQGETLVPGSNVTETTVGAELSRLAAMIS